MDIDGQNHTRTSLLSPISPVSSPETADVLQNAERLVRNAQKQLNELSFNATLNALDENPQCFIGQQPLDESLLYIRELVDSKFQESRDPDRTYSRKAPMYAAAHLTEKLQHDQFPVKESNYLLNKPLEISAQNSAFSADQMGKEMFIQSGKPFFKKAPNWFNIEPPKHINVFPTSGTNNLKSKTKSTCTVPCCTVTNNGVIEINSRDQPTSTIKVQTGPTVDIRGGLTIQTIENVHISPNSSTVPIYNNIATYCFRHEPSTSSGLADSTEPHAEKHVDKDVTHASRDMMRTPQISSRSNNDDNNNRDNVELNSSSPRNRVSNQSILIKSTNLHKFSSNNGNLRTPEEIQESIDNDTNSNTHVKKTVSISLSPVRNSIHEEIPVVDIKDAPGNGEEDSGLNDLPANYNKISSHMNCTTYGGQNLHYVQSDTEHAKPSQINRDECMTGSCSRKCERDVEQNEKQKLKEALEAIANIEKLRFNVKDTGVVPTECTQVCAKETRIVNATGSRTEPFTDSEQFKMALKNLCQFSNNTIAAKMDTNSKIYQEAIDNFVKTFFDSNSQSDSIHELGANMESNGVNNEPDVQLKIKEEAQPLEHVEIIPKQKKIDFRTRISTIGIPRAKNVTPHSLTMTNKNTARSSVSHFRAIRFKDPIKSSNSSARQHSQLSVDEIIQHEKPQSGTISSKEEIKYENLELNEPSVLDVDAVSKIYHESMAAICQGTEQLSQLISHHVMKNASATNNPNLDLTVPDCDFLRKPEINPHNTARNKILGPPALSPTSRNSRIPQQQSNSLNRKKSKDESHVQKTRYTGASATEVEQDQISENKDDRSIGRDAARFDNQKNSICTSKTWKSATDEYSSTFCESFSEEERTLSNNNEKSSSEQSNIENDKSNRSALPEVQKKTAIIATQPTATQDRKVENVTSKSGAKKFMNVGYCVTEQPNAQIPLEVPPDENMSTIKSGLENSLSTYLQLENACGKSMILHRHSSYDICSEQTADINSYKYPVLISRCGDNYNSSHNDFNDKLTEAVGETKEVELLTNKVFGEILDAVKNSSQFTEKFLASLFNEMEIDSIDDIAKNLKAAAVRPIVIEQLSVILREKNKVKSFFGGNLIPHNLIPEYDKDCQKNRHNPEDVAKTNDGMNNLNNSTCCNGNLETTNIRNEKFDEIPPELRLMADLMTKHQDSTSLEMGPIFEFAGDDVHSIHIHNNENNKTLEKVLPSGPIQSGMICEKFIAETDSKNDHESLSIFETTSKNKCYPLVPVSKLLAKNSGSSASENEVQEISQKNLQEIKDTSFIEEYNCPSNDTSTKDQRNVNASSRNTDCSHTMLRQNDSLSNTDKDISFTIPHDSEVDKKFLDLSNIQKLTSVTMKNENTGEIIGFHVESSCSNCLRLNSSAQEKRKKINSHSDTAHNSSVTEKSSGKSNDLNFPTNNLASATRTLQNDHNNVTCCCRTSNDRQDLEIGSFLVPCQSRFDEADVQINMQVRNNFKQLGLLDSEKKEAPQTPKKVVSVDEKTLNKRQRPTKRIASTKSHGLEAPAQNVSNGNKKKSRNKKVVGNNKVSAGNNKQSLPKNVKNVDNTDSTKSDSKYVCLLCVKLQGKCSCSDYASYVTDSKGHKKTPLNMNVKKDKLDKNVSPSRSNSPKSTGHSAGKSLSRSTPVPSEAGKNINSKVAGQEIAKNSARRGKSPAPIPERTKLKPNVGSLSSDSNNSNEKCGFGNNLCKKKQVSQAAGSDSDNLKVEDKPQDTSKAGGFTICRSTETQKNNSQTVQNQITVLDKADQTSSTKFCVVEEIITADKPPVREVGTMQCFDTCASIQGRTVECKINYHDKTNTADKSISRCTEMKQVFAIASQTSENFPSPQSPHLNEAKTISESGTVSLVKPSCPNIFDNGNIVVLQPLNELAHTYFIAKPNSLERKLIQEKMNKSFNITVEQMADPNCPVNNDIIKESTNCNAGNRTTGIDSMPLISSTNTTNCGKFKECAVDCPGDVTEENIKDHKQSNEKFAPKFTTDSTVRFSENTEQCVDSCVNASGETFQCEQDCPNEEICMKLCPPIPEVRPSLQQSSINVSKLLKKFIAERGLLQEFEDSMRRYQTDKLGTIHDKSSSQNCNDKARMKNAGKPLNEAKTRCPGVESKGKSVQYDERHESIDTIMTNRKSLNLPNVVRGIADMHPSTKLERLKILPPDPLVSGSFNKSESDRRYSVFNQPDPGNSSINLSDPKTVEHLAGIAEAAKVKEREDSPTDSFGDIIQSNLTKIDRKLSSTGKSDKNNVSKLKKSRREMDGDLYQRSCEHDNNSIKSFKSSDLEPGQFLQVRTPFDYPIQSCESSGRCASSIKGVSQEAAKCNEFRNEDENYPQSIKNYRGNTHTWNRIKSQQRQYGVHSNSGKKINTRKRNRSIINKLVHESENVCPRANGVEEDYDETDSEFGVSNDQPVCHKVQKFSHKLKTDQMSETERISRLEKLSSTECSSRSEIINHFLGRTKLEDLGILYTNDRTNPVFREAGSLDSNCRRLRSKSNSSKAISNLQNCNITESLDPITIYHRSVEFNILPRISNERHSAAKSNITSSECRDQTLSDTYSEGEINIPSSCSYSLGEVKISTPSGMIAGRSFKDQDGFTIIVTKSILDSTHANCNSPGEILAELQNTESDVSSNIV